MRFKALFPLVILSAIIFFACHSPAAKPKAPEQPITIGGLPWAGNQDLVCKMSIDPSTEDTLHYEGKVYGFCSESCQAKFQENPAKFVVK
jgi:YHS domain-containing protein